ncbi:phosphopantetheine-binding protein [Streptomyces sp. NPDC057638]|uniref:phosphopantetheine-binding protein n=1 Tax=Streptomyces sp. NPDC057638 TaxID=3346190 RepID=UPI0036831BD4
MTLTPDRTLTAERAAHTEPTEPTASAPRTPHPAPTPPGDGAPTVTARVHAALTRRLGEPPITERTELAALGVDSLLLLRILADLAADPTQEVDPQRLADVITVADLVAFVDGWN